MRNNKSLAAAITTALSFAPGIVAGQVFENVDNAALATVADETGNVFNLGGAAPYTYGVPIPRFDFTGGETIVFVDNEKAKSESDPGGLLFASELFGSGNLVLPTPRSGKTTGQYMAVVYTIDGDVVSNFDMTFTLDGGAVFATEPVLGVLDAAGGGSVTVSSVTAPANASASASMTAADSSLTADTVFQFDTAGSPLYQVAKATATTPSSITFFELGNSLTQVPGNVPATSTKVYKSTGAAGQVTSVVIPAGAITGTLATAGATALEVKDANVFTAGWSYVCNSVYGAATKAAEPVFRVTNKVTTTTPHKLLVSVLNATIAGTGNFGSTATCSQTSAIYRVHVTGDSVISVNATTGFVKGHTYQFDNKGAVAATNGATTVVSHQTTKYMVTDIGTNAITIQNMTSATRGLDLTIQDAEKLYDTAIDKGDSWSTVNVTAGVPKKAKSSAIGKSSATFVLNAGQTTPVNLALTNNDQIMLLYKLGTVNQLADPGQTINMAVDLKAAFSGMIVNPHRTIAVAKSAKALNAKLKSIEGGTLHIAVSTGETQFVGETSNSLVGFVDNYIAQIGQLVIKTDDSTNIPKMEDGVTDFALGPDAVLAEKSTLTITGGQFEASRTLPGQAYLQVGPNSSRVADSISQDADGWTAIWNLNSTMLKEIYDNNVINGEDDVDGNMIRIRTDSIEKVNVPEGKPNATLIINYDNVAYQDLEVESSLRKITRDGTVCTVYNVPPPKKGVIGADQLSIRVTNDSALSGKLKGILYSQEGGDPIWTGDLTTTEVPAGATERFTSEDLATITGTTWDGRAVLEISTILPKIEVLALIRQNGIRMAPLSNLSAGAHGVSCAQD